MESENKCPVSHGAESQHTQGARSNHQWWPDNINLDIDLTKRAEDLNFKEIVKLFRYFN